MAIDRAGNEIHVGDIVVFVPPKCEFSVRATVIKITKKMVKLHYIIGGYDVFIRQLHDQVLVARHKEERT